MNVLIVHAHPEPHSFTSALKSLAETELTAQGHTVTVTDLYAERFQAVAGPDDFLTRSNPEYLNLALEQRHNVASQSLSPDIQQALDRLMAADLLVFTFPLYWFSVPAILKGWFDRVFVSGQVYGGRRFYGQGGLQGKRALLVVTTGGRDYMLQPGGIHGDLTDMLKPVLQGTLGYAGCTVLPPFMGYHVPYLSDEQRHVILDDFQHYLRRLDTLEPLPMPDLAQFDAQMRPRSES